MQAEYEETEFVSKLVRAPVEKRLPSDLLDERRSFMRHVTRTAAGSIPTVEDLMKHANRFGTEYVTETAAELGYGLDACIRLTDHCDRVDAAAFHKERPHAAYKEPKSAEMRCKLLLGIEDDDEE